MMMLDRMDRDFMTYRVSSALLRLGAFKGALDGTFHEFFGAPSVHFIPTLRAEGMKNIYCNMLRSCLHDRQA